MNTDTIIERVGGMAIASALLLKTSLGSESPGVVELLNLELPRLLMLPSLFRHVPSYSSLDSIIARDIMADPWDRTVGLDVLLTTWARDIVEREEIDSDLVVSIIEEYAFVSDITAYSVIRRGTSPLSDADAMMDFIDDACAVLDIDLDMVYMYVYDVYTSFFNQIQVA